MLNETSSYQIALLGSDHELIPSFIEAVLARATELGLPTSFIVFLNERETKARDQRIPLMAVFFGSNHNNVNTPLIADLVEDSVVIAPLVSALTAVHSEIPPQLRHINALSLAPGGGGLDRLVSLVFETFRLLRKERRLFISYKRAGSQPLAQRLYDALDGRGFDVFIDVRTVPPAADFQSQLWHRLSDSDVVILIDTPGFREGRWTAEELAKANATNIQILHLLWPGIKEDSSSAFSHFFKLQRSDFLGFIPLRGQFAKEDLIFRVCDEAERLRARAMAARQKNLIDNFCDAARDNGLEPAVQTEGWISVETSNDNSLAVVPAVGVPTSDRINDIFLSIKPPVAGNQTIWIIYDSRGVLSKWMEHLDWLDSHLPVRTVQMAKAPQLLSELVA